MPDRFVLGMLLAQPAGVVAATEIACNALGSTGSASQPQQRSPELGGPVMFKSKWWAGQLVLRGCGVYSAGKSPNFKKPGA